MPAATEFRTYLHLEKEVRIADQFGEEYTEWRKAGSIRGSLDEDSGSEQTISGQKTTIYRGRLTANYRPDVSSWHRLVDPSSKKIYEIESATDSARDNRRWILITTVRKNGVT